MRQIYLFIILALAAIASAYATESSPVQQPNFKLDGRTAADLSAEWWRVGDVQPGEKTQLGCRWHPIPAVRSVPASCIFIEQEEEQPALLKEMKAIA